MAKLRKFVSYRNVKRPNTRISKYRKKSFVKARPNMRLARFVYGDRTKEFSHKLFLVTKSTLQLRSNALESSRLTANRYLERNVGKGNYRLVIRKYPHHILRENPLASGAGADRLSTGMAHSFGKPIGTAAQVKKGDYILEVCVDKTGIDIAKVALKRSSQKLPNKYSVEVVDFLAQKKMKGAKIVKKSSKSSEKKTEKKVEKEVKPIEVKPIEVKPIEVKPIEVKPIEVKKTEEKKVE